MTLESIPEGKREPFVEQLEELGPGQVRATLLASTEWGNEDHSWKYRVAKDWLLWKDIGAIAHTGRGALRAARTARALAVASIVIALVALLL